MVEPVSLGLAAAALLGSKFVEGLAKDAGSSSWRAVVSLRDLVVAKLGNRPENVLALTELERDPSPDNRASVAEIIDEAGRADPGFAAAARQLIDAARADKSVDVFVAQAYDQAKQVNIHGGNSGTINL
ncbi:hypothetical protein [Nocardia africana]